MLPSFMKCSSVSSPPPSQAPLLSRSPPSVAGIGTSIAVGMIFHTFVLHTRSQAQANHSVCGSRTRIVSTSKPSHTESRVESESPSLIPRPVMILIRVSSSSLAQRHLCRGHHALDKIMVTSDRHQCHQGGLCGAHQGCMEVSFTDSRCLVSHSLMLALAGRSGAVSMYDIPSHCPHRASVEQAQAHVERGLCG